MTKQVTGKVFTLSALVVAISAAMPATAQDSGVRHLEEVVVTAQRRDESIQDVPVAVTAVTSEDLEMAQVDSIANIQQISPSIKFDVTNSAANSANILIRGIGTVGNSRAFEGAVGVFVDGVYRSRAGQAMQNWLDIDGLQVLRGPQGTLFGKNTSAGALIINSKVPSLESTEIDYEMGVGSYGKQMVRGAVNLPIGDTLAMRVAGLWGEKDGYIENPNGGAYNERNPRAAKVQFLYEPSDAFNAHLIMDWSEESNNCCYGQMDAVDGPTQPLIDSLIAARGLQLPSKDFDDYEQVLSNDTDQNVKDKGAVLKMNWNLDSGQTISSVTGYRDWSIAQDGMDADFTGANIFTINEYLQSKMFSQEFTLSGDVGDFAFFESGDYVVGLYYADEDIDAGNQLVWEDQAQTYWDAVLYLGNGFPPGTGNADQGLWADSSMPATSKTYAAFMHWNLDITDKLGLSVGLRYSKDEKTGQMYRNYFTPVPNTIFTLIGAQPGPEYKDSFADSAVTGSLALKYHFSENIMGYASYSRGYKAGGVNIDNNAAGGVMQNPDLVPGAVPGDPSYKSEFVDGYELGLKTGYWDGRARTNIAAFYNDIQDLQLAQFQGTAFSIDNAPEAEVYGIEIENQFLLTDALSLNLDITHLTNAQFGDDPILGFLADRDFAQAPELAANLALMLDQPLGNGMSLFGRIGAAYSGEQYTNTSNDYKRDEEVDYTASIGLRSDDGAWSVSAWCQNCTDERYVTQHFNSPLQAGDSNAYVTPPRTYGLTVRGSF